MTVSQLFLAICDFLLFIVLGVIFIRQWMIFRSLKETQRMTLETRRMITADVDERKRWVETRFGVKEKDRG
jgi:hypothetical protein